MTSEAHSADGPRGRVADFKFLSGTGVGRCELIEEEVSTSVDLSTPSDRRFLVINGQYGNEQLAIGLKHIGEGEAQVTIEKLAEDDAHVRLLPLGEVLQTALYASGVRTANLDPEGTDVEPAVLNKAGFQPTAELGQYAVAA